MKFAKSLFVAAAGVLALAACNKTEPLGPEDLTISATEVAFEQAGGTKTITLKSTLDWTIKDYTDEVKAWLVVDPSSGSASNNEVTITLKAGQNDDVNRTATIVFYGNLLHKASLVISQPGAKGDGQNLTVKEFLDKKDTQNSYKLTGVIGNISKGTSYYGFYLKDETGEVCCPFPENWADYKDKVATGATVTLSGVYSYYESKSQDQVKNCTIEEYTAPSTENIKTVTVAEMISKADAYSIYRLTGTVASAVSTTYCSFTLKDDTGSILVYTVNNASEWASVVKQNGTVTLRGAFQLYNTTPEIVDCDIEKFEAGQGGDDKDAIYSNTFLAGQGDFTIENKTKPDALAAVWTNNSSYGMVGSGYDSDSQANYDTESWLVSPVIDLSSQSKAYLEFEHACNFFSSVDVLADQATVWARVENGEWAKVSGLKYPTALGWSFVTSGSIDLAAYTGKKMQFAFVYKSTSAKAGTWEVKNVKVVKTASEQGGGETGGDADVTWTVGSGNQSWAAGTDATYGAGYAATVDGITVGYYKGSSTSDAVAAKTDHIRVYKSSALKITSSEKTLTKVIITCSGSDYCADLTGVGTSNATANTSDLTITWTGSAKELVFTSDVKQVRISKIAYYFAK